VGSRRGLPSSGQRLPRVLRKTLEVLTESRGLVRGTIPSDRYEPQADVLPTRRLSAQARPLLPGCSGSS